MFVQELQTPENLEAIALINYIDELGRQLNSKDEACDEDDFIPRSPSPPPEYDKHGKRTNTREHRMRNALNVERTLAVRKALELIPNYCPPSDFNRLARIVEKYPIPVRDFPQINFVGLLLGPRGNALRRMEADSGARISIRGRGSVKEGSRSATTQQGQEEDLHCLVSATSHESIKKAFGFIEQVIDTATQTPEHQNDFKRLQLRELAELNGTLRDYENQLCTYCGEPGHRKIACAQREAALKDAVCRACGQQGHMIRDCESSEAQSLRATQSAGLQAFFNDLEDDPHTETDNKSMREPGTRISEAVSETLPSENSTAQMPSSSSSEMGRALIASPKPLSPGPPGIESRIDTPTGTPIQGGLAPPPGMALPPGIVAPSAMAPPPGIAPPGIVPPGVLPPGMQSAGNAPPGILSTSSEHSPSGVAPVLGTPSHKGAPPSAWKPPTWKPPATPS